MQTKQQKRAQAAYDCVSGEIPGDKDAYLRLARKFPALVHTCGLAQSLAFVAAKEKEKGGIGETYLSHLSSVMALPDNTDLQKKSRDAGLMEYQHLSREAIESATWIKRYAEALLETD